MIKSDFIAYSERTEIDIFCVSSCRLTHKPLLIEIASFAVFLFLGYYSKVSKLLLAARQHGMFNGEFAFITVDFIIEEKWANEAWFKDKSGNKYEIKNIYNAFLDLSAEKPDLENKNKNFSLEVRRRMADSPFNRAMKSNEKVCTEKSFLLQQFKLDITSLDKDEMKYFIYKSD